MSKKKAKPLASGVIYAICSAKRVSPSRIAITIELVEYEVSVASCHNPTAKKEKK